MDSRDSDERPVAPSAVTSTISVAPHKIAITEAPQRIVLDVPLRTVGKVLVAILVFSITVSLLESVRTVLVWVGMALFIAIALNPAVVRVEQLMRRNWAVVCVFFGFIVGLIVVVTLLVAPFVSQINDLPKTAPHIAERLTRNPLIHRLDQHYNIVAKAEAHAGSAPSIVFGAAGAVINGIAATVTVLFLAAFILFELPNINRLILSQLRPPAAGGLLRLGPTSTGTLAAMWPAIYSSR